MKWLDVGFVLKGENLPVDWMWSHKVEKTTMTPRFLARANRVEDTVVVRARKTWERWGMWMAWMQTGRVQHPRSQVKRVFQREWDQHHMLDINEVGWGPGHLDKTGGELERELADWNMLCPFLFYWCVSVRVWRILYMFVIVIVNVFPGLEFFCFISIFKGFLTYLDVYKHLPLLL